MKRIHAIVDGYVQKVGYREHVRKEAIKIGLSGYVENLKTDEVLIVAEGGEADLKRFLSEIVITRYPMMVTSCNVTWHEGNGEFKKFVIIRGDIQEETFERMDYAGILLHEILDVTKQTLDVSKQTLDVSKQTLDVSKQTLDISKQTLDISKQTLDISKQTLVNTTVSLELQHNMLDKQDQMLQIGRETKDEIVYLRKETGKCLDDEFREIKKKLISIEDALQRAGIQV